MRRLFFQLLFSVDGYFDEPHHEFHWFVVDGEFLACVDGMLGSIDGMLPGRTTCEGFAAN